MVWDLAFPVSVTERSWVKWKEDEERKEESVELLFCLSRLKHILYSNRQNFKRHLSSWKHKILLSYTAWSPFHSFIIGA